MSPLKLFYKRFMTQREQRAGLFVRLTQIARLAYNTYSSILQYKMAYSKHEKHPFNTNRDTLFVRLLLAMFSVCRLVVVCKGRLSDSMRGAYGWWHHHLMKTRTTTNSLHHYNKTQIKLYTFNSLNRFQH